MILNGNESKLWRKKLSDEMMVISFLKETKTILVTVFIDFKDIIFETKKVKKGSKSGSPEFLNNKN